MVGTDKGWDLSLKKSFQEGYSTGSCAAAAARAAAHLLMHKEYLQAVEVELPEGDSIIIPIKCVSMQGSTAIAETVKDGGDDPDVTHGLSVIAAVELTTTSQVIIEGGQGVGRVTKPGLAVPMGKAAINPVPHRMITAAVKRELEAGYGARVTISVPEGEKVAHKTMNPRLGISGGISILGTTGRVRPMSREAYLQALIPQLDQALALGHSTLVLVPGALGTRRAGELGLPAEAVIQCSNFFGDMLDECGERRIDGILLLGHLGKMIKLAGGNFNTHSRVSDARREILTAHLALAGADRDLLRAIMQVNTMEESVDIVKEHGMEEVFNYLALQCSIKARQRLAADIKIGSIFYRMDGSIVGYDQESLEIRRRFTCQ